MKTITMVDLRSRAAQVLLRLSNGERLLLSYRGKQVARLEPFHSPEERMPETDPFLTVATRAKPSKKSAAPHDHIDSFVYGKR